MKYLNCHAKPLQISEYRWALNMRLQTHLSGPSGTQFAQGLSESVARFFSDHQLEIHRRWQLFRHRVVLRSKKRSGTDGLGRMAEPVIHQA